MHFNYFLIHFTKNQKYSLNEFTRQVDNCLSQEFHSVSVNSNFFKEQAKELLSKLSHLQNTSKRLTDIIEVLKISDSTLETLYSAPIMNDSFSMALLSISDQYEEFLLLKDDISKELFEHHEKKYEYLIKEVQHNDAFCLLY